MHADSDPSHTNTFTVPLVQATTISHLDYCNSSQMVFLFVSLPSPLLRNMPWLHRSLRRNYNIHIMDTRPYMIWCCTSLFLFPAVSPFTQQIPDTLASLGPSNLLCCPPSIDHPDPLFTFLPSTLCLKRQASLFNLSSTSP